MITVCSYQIVTIGGVVSKRPVIIGKEAPSAVFPLPGMTVAALELKSKNLLNFKKIATICMAAVQTATLMSRINAEINNKFTS